MEQSGFERFDVMRVALSGKNLVEASAGTGKTFSIGILTLRLVLEQDIDIDKILLVTFTNNAVAELEERIRLFVRQAHDAIVFDSAAPPHISEVVAQAVAMHGREIIEQRLKDAILFLDQLSIMTIHGFCHQCLKNQAFETGQLFGAELKSSMTEMYEVYVQDFWRKEINTLPSVVYGALIDKGKLTPKVLVGLIKSFYAHKRFYLYDPGRVVQSLTGRGSVLDKLQEEQEALRQQFDEYVTRHREKLREAMSGNRYAKKQSDRVDAAPALWSWASDQVRKRVGYMDDLFPEECLGYISKYLSIEEKIVAEIHALLDEIYCFAISEVSQRIDAHIASSGIISYDGLIQNLHKATTGAQAAGVVNELQDRYKAVFVDEFQDTDKLQYEIFKKAFHSNTILFYIGDPKQSIYAFRQADINTYLGAYSDVDKLYSMNTNFRSSPRLVAELNHFFLPDPDFDTFAFGDTKGIRYLPVEASEKPRNELLYDQQPIAPVTISKWPDMNALHDNLVARVFQLLTDEKYEIGDRRIRPSDIGILVHSGVCGKDIKERLSKINVPAVMLNDDKIMESEEAGSLYHLLKAMYDPTISNIYTGLVSKFIGKPFGEMLTYSSEQLLDLFRGYKAQWEANGINQAIAAFMTDFGVRNYLTRPDTPNGLRMISNLEQLKELLIKAEYQQRLNPHDLLDWMKRAKDLELLEEDEAVIRLENDADAVTIITIHRSKGLEYNIVFCPQSDLPVRDYKKDDFVDLYEDGEYIVVPSRQMTDEQIAQYETRQRQENRRLLYVALTRSVYAVFVYQNEKLLNSSILTDFLVALQHTGSIPVHEGDGALQAGRYFPGIVTHPVPAQLTSPFVLPDANWQFMSYSRLAGESKMTSVALPGLSSEVYDTFAFNQLRRGVITGTLLHELFEKIDFQDDRLHSFIIDDVLYRYAASQKDLYSTHFPSLIRHVLTATINTGTSSFCLADLSWSQRLHEMEFNYPVNAMETTAFMQLCQDAGYDVSMVRYSVLSGMMNGYIDLLFEHGGKYYILDWKSNYLGGSAEDYQPESQPMQDAMSHYHLQYLIYSVAAVRYLQKRVRSFDYQKHFGGIIYGFLRGMRSGCDTGIYFHLPPEQFISALSKYMYGEVVTAQQ